MTFKCPFCEEESGFKDASNHIKMRHKGQSLEQYNCGYCPRNFLRLQSLLSHMKKKHDGNEDIPAAESNPEENNPTPELHKIPDRSQPATVQPETIDGTKTNLQPMDNILGDQTKFDLSQFSHSIFHDISSFVTPLYANDHLPRALAQNIINQVGQLITGIFSRIASIPQEITGSDMKSISAVIDNTFGEFSSEHKCLKNLESSASFISSTSKVITSELNRKRKRNVVSLVPKEIKIEVIPMAMVLKQFLELPNVLQTILAHMEVCKEGKLFSSPLQSPTWQNIESLFPDKLVLPLIIYIDEFEANNPLGSHRGIHKIGAVYFSLACIPDEYKGMLENIFLAQLYKNKDYEELTNQIIFANLLNDIKSLQQQGVEIKIDGKSRVIYFSLLAVIGDNLSQNTVLGFSPSFNALQVCRFCTVTKSILQEQTVEDPALLRTEETYTENVEACSNGIKEECVFNDGAYFHCLRNKTADATHDFEEGTCRYSIGNVLSSLITNYKFFSLEALNFKVKYFNYGGNHGLNVPPPITEAALKKKHIIMSASEMKVFVHNLIFYVGELVPEETEEWKLYLTLRRVMITVYKSFYTPEDIAQVRKDVSHLNSSYVKLFGLKLPPKFHFLVHYPGLMELMGPLHHFATIRWEGKHKSLKKTAKVTTSRINLIHTLGHKHQLIQCNNFMYRPGFSSRLSWGLAKADTITHLNDYHQFMSVVPLTAATGYFFVSWVKMFGTHYEVHSCIDLQTIDSRRRDFGMIQHIGVDREGSVLFIYKQMKILGFSEHFQSFEMQVTQNWGWIFQRDLLQYRPVNISTLSNGKKLVSDML